MRNQCAKREYLRCVLHWREDVKNVFDAIRGEHVDTAFSVKS